ncbi:putative phage abortive infection protein [Marinifilum sp. D714]|uniref:putative phage abortive infection protein n=1 Tax=Marinifilum sp. D714 TaxID=2937523 RepID=UPI0027C2722A|nr:putative phage abortive infection protein [Marinifilum sp. D714]MDQ2178793.1 putative phage abortive infection protein [Marinifilum sp. D714]
MEIIYWILLIVAIVLSAIAIWPYLKITTRNSKKWIAGSAIFCWCILLIVLFISSTGNSITWNINTGVWSQFGSFIGAFLLAGTLLFQIRSFRRQQIEAKFFEMIKYYRENVKEMRYRNPFYYDENGRKPEEEVVTGRRAIKTIFDQYKVARRLCHTVIKVDPYINCDSNDLKIKRALYNEKEYNQFKNSKGEYLEFKFDVWQEKYNLNEIAYHIMFWGIPLDVEDELRNYIDNLITGYKPKLFEVLENQKNTNKSIYFIIKKIVTVWESSNKISHSKNLKSKDDFKLKELIDNNAKGKVKFFGGHQYHLGHYFRHLYQAVKYIDGQPIWLLSLDDKKDMIKTLRAQMSNYEQALLFINSLTKLGRNWEYERQGEGLISKYNLIKNLPENFIPYMRPQYYYPKVDFEWYKGISDNSKKKTPHKIDMSFDDKIKLWTEDISFLGLIWKKYRWDWQLIIYSSNIFSAILLFIWTNNSDNVNYWWLLLPCLGSFVFSVFYSRKKTAKVIKNEYSEILISDKKWSQQTIRLIKRGVLKKRIGERLDNAEFVQFFIDTLDRRNSYKKYSYPFIIMVTSSIVSIIVTSFYNAILDTAKSLDGLMLGVFVFFALLILVGFSLMLDNTLKGIWLILRSKNQQLIYCLEDLLEELKFGKK